MTSLPFALSSPFDPMPPLPGILPLPAEPEAGATRGERRGQAARAAATDPDEDEDVGDEEDLSVAQPLADEDSAFDDFDDEFDDDFEEEENDPDWDHPDEGDEPPPPSKSSGRKK